MILSGAIRSAKARALRSFKMPSWRSRKVDFLTPNGRYDRSREGAMAAKGLVTISGRRACEARSWSSAQVASGHRVLPVLLGRR